jgi:Uma2 family endonuclease
MPEPVNFRAVLREAMTGRAYNLRQLAGASGVGYASVHRYLNGDGGLTADNLAKLLTALSVTVRSQTEASVAEIMPSVAPPTDVNARAPTRRTNGRGVTAVEPSMHQKLITADEYAALPDDRRTELVNGRVVESPWPDFLHGCVQAEIGTRLANFVESYDLGHVVAGTGIVTTRKPDTVRGADVSFFSSERIPKHEIPEGYPAVAPEIVFEIVSAFDRMGEMLWRIGEFLMAGVRCVCAVDPRRRSAVVYGEGGSIAVLSENDLLRLPAPLADWTPRVRDFFPE